MSRLWILMLTCGLVLGCTPRQEPVAASVRGSVLFQGRPLAGGMVVFAPDRDKGTLGQPLAATLDLEGRYTLETGGKPIPAGWYRVAIAESPADPLFESIRFPAALRRPDRSGLEREILPGQANVFHFEIELLAD